MMAHASRGYDASCAKAREPRLKRSNHRLQSAHGKLLTPPSRRAKVRGDFSCRLQKRPPSPSAPLHICKRGPSPDIPGCQPTNSVFRLVGHRALCGRRIRTSQLLTRKRGRPTLPRRLAHHPATGPTQSPGPARGLRFRPIVCLMPPQCSFVASICHESGAKSAAIASLRRTSYRRDRRNMCTCAITARFFRMLHQMDRTQHEKARMRLFAFPHETGDRCQSCRISSTNNPTGPST
jgi:hypothetical protein